MLRTRFMAAATAALLVAGMSVGGAGAAFAETDDGLAVVDETAVLEASVEVLESPVASITEPVLAPAVKPVDPGDSGGGTADSPCNFEPGFGTGTKITPGEGGVPVSGSETYEWGTLEWSQYELVFTAEPGWTVDLCVKGGSQESNSIELDTGSVTIPRVQSISHFMWANPTFNAPVASASITTNPRDCDSPTTWNFDTDTISNATWGAPFVEDGLIKIVATATGGALFAGNQTTQTFTAPFQAAGGEDCEEEPTEVAPAASVEQITCLNDELVGGIITVDLTQPGVDYSIEDADGNPVAFDAVTGETAALEPGDYTVFGVDADDTDRYDVSDYEQEFTVDEFDGVCGDLPPLANWPASASGSPEDCIEDELVDGTIDVVFPVIPDGDPAPIRYYVDYEGPNEVELTEASTQFPAGDYMVTAVVTDPDDSVNDSGQSDEFEVTVGEYDGECTEVSPLVNWPASAVGTNQMCAIPGVMTSGTITVVFPDKPAEDPNPVRYFVAYGTPQQTELVHNVTPVAPGSHTVTAVAAEPTDTLNDAGNTAEFTVNVGAASEVECAELDTLAFTGASAFTEWLGVAAVLMMLAGMGFVLRRNRVEV